ncbi:GumC family protein [Tianweitania sp.]|uniref:GumC family protein n=1 Tax=Tianweitania sp. TaxID=2021634 RepID=UPI00289F72D8|nr:GumC family protein [Tianweitania sp.]
MSQILGRKASPLSSEDFNIDALDHRARRRPAGGSLLLTAKSLADRDLADDRSTPQAAKVEQTAAAAGSLRSEAPTTTSPSDHRADRPSPVTVAKVGEFLELDFRRLFTWLRAGFLLACILAVIGALAGGGYGLLAKKRYTVATDILLNPTNLQVVNDDLYVQSGQIDNQLLNIRSKQRVLTSRNVLARVVDDLNLASEPEFGDGASDPKLTALRRLQESIKVQADEGSFVTTLLVTAQTPDKAIEISQAIVKTFQDELAEAESNGASRAATALDSRLGQLRADVQTAEKKIEDYRRDQNLSSSYGQLVSSQTMTQLNTQIVQAQARASAAQADYDALVAGGANGTNASPSVSETLVALRNEANRIRQELESQSAQLGPRHPSILKLRVALDTVTAQVRTEYLHTVEVAKGSRDATKNTMDSLVARMNDLQGNVFADRESEVALRELERDATSKTAIYESFLSRARQITERQQIDTTNVQVISTAVPPNGRSWPPRTIVLAAGGAIAGFALGLLLALIMGIRRDLRDEPDDYRRPAYGV